jgi:hypothetical protein
VLSRALYLLLVLLSGPFALHVLANRSSQSKTLAGTSSEEVKVAPPSTQVPAGSVQQSSPGQQQSPSATLSLPLNFQRNVTYLPVRPEQLEPALLQGVVRWPRWPMPTHFRDRK